MSEGDLLFELKCLQKRSAKRRFRESIFSAWEECAYCGLSDPYTIDHIVPKSKGGETIRKNLVGACAECNMRKGSDDFFVWFRSQSFWSEERELKLLSWINQPASGMLLESCLPPSDNGPAESLSSLPAAC